MARKDSSNNSFADLVARLKAMSDITPEQERSQLMEAARQEPKILDDKELSLSDIAKLAGIKEYVEAGQGCRRRADDPPTFYRRGYQRVRTAIAHSSVDGCERV